MMSVQILDVMFDAAGAPVQSASLAALVVRTEIYPDGSEIRRYLYPVFPPKTETHGEAAGHPFRGNQYTDVAGSSEMPRMSAEEYRTETARYHQHQRDADRLRDVADAATDAYLHAGGALERLGYNPGEVPGKNPSPLHVQLHAEYVKAQSESMAADAEYEAHIAKEADFSIEFWHKKFELEPDLLEKQMSAIASDWAHIGGDGPMRVRLAAASAFGLDEGMAYDSKKGRAVTLEEFDAQDKLVMNMHAAAMRHEYEEVQRELETKAIEMRHKDYDYPTILEWSAQSGEEDTQEFKSGLANFVSRYRSDASLMAPMVTQEQAAAWLVEREDEVVRAVGGPPSWPRNKSGPVLDVARETLHQLGAEADSPQASEKIGRVMKEMSALEPRLSSVARRLKILYPAVANANTAGDAARRDKLLGLIDRLNSESATTSHKLGDMVIRAAAYSREGDYIVKRQISEAAMIAAESLRTYSNEIKLHRALADPDGSIATRIKNTYINTGYPVSPEAVAKYNEWREAEIEKRSVIKITPGSWPVELYRGVSVNVANYVPNYAESWSAAKGTVKGFGERLLQSKTERSRVLVFQGSKFWKASPGGFGVTEQEMILLPQPPKWKRKQASK